MTELFVLAHNIRSIHNVGSIFRTCDAAGVKQLFLAGYTATPPDPRIAKVALGAEDYLPWRKYVSPVVAIRHMRKLYPDLTVIALENNVLGRTPVSIYDVSLQGPTVLLVGEETIGLPQSLLKLADQLVELPMRGQKESLNVSVALSAALYLLTSPSN